MSDTWWHGHLGHALDEDTSRRAEASRRTGWKPVPLGRSSHGR